MSAVLKRLGLYRPYQPRRFDTQQKALTDRDTIIADERFRIALETTEYILRYRLTTTVTPVLTIPLVFNPSRRVFEIAEAPAVAEARIQAYFYGAALPYLAEPGYHPPALDSKGRLFVNNLENDYTVMTVDLTTARTDVALGLSGTSLTVLRKGGASWSFKFNAPTKPAISSDWFGDGTVFEIEFSEIYVTNSAAPAGTAPAVLYVGRRI